MAERRRGLGRGLGALIPPVQPGAPRPIDVFFAEHDGASERPPGVGDVVDLRDPAPGSPPSSAAEQAAAHPADADVAVDPGALLPVPGVEFLDLPIEQVVPNPRQPRRAFDDDALAELVHSIAEIGVLQPVVVRRTEPSGGLPRYELVMGERRWRASQAAGLPTVPAIVRETRDDALLRDALLENLHRSDLNPLEEAAAYQQLLDDFGCTHDQLAQRIGRSRPQISNTIRLLRLPPSVQRRVAAGVLSAGHARAILGMPDGGAMERLAQRVSAENLSVRATEEAVALGDDSAVAAPRRASVAVPLPPEVAGVAAQLADRLETRVSVVMGRRRGKLVVEFAGADDLARIVAALAPRGADADAVD